MMVNEPLLLVGDSPNRLTDTNSSWENLLKSLRREARLGEDGHQDKPFTLHFEELRNGFHARYLESNPHTSWKQSDEEFRTLVAEKLNTLQPSRVHKAIMHLPMTDILTTNYDYCLERALLETDEIPPNADWGFNPVRYAHFLRRAAWGKFTHHIHGESGKPRIIMLGHEAYVESCARIRRCSSADGLGLKMRIHKEGKVIGQRSVRAKFREGPGIMDPSQPHSWVDLFMLRDVHIIGLALEATEVDLWYLISYKARLKHDPYVPQRLRDTDITFHYFEDGSEKTMYLDLLASFGVRCVPHEVPKKWVEGRTTGLSRRMGQIIKQTAGVPFLMSNPQSIF